MAFPPSEPSWLYCMKRSGCIMEALASTLRTMGNVWGVLSTGGTGRDFMFTKDPLTALGRADGRGPRVGLPP